MKEKIIYAIVGLTVVALAGVVVWASVQDKTTSDSPTKTIGATIFPLADAAEIIAGSDYNVVQILPSGQSTHTYEPTPSAISELSDADVVFKIGLELDDWVDSVSESASSDTDIIEVNSGVDLICGEDGTEKSESADHDEDEHDQDEHEEDSHDEDEYSEEEDEDEHDHEHGACNPHIWLSPSNMEIVVDNITQVLSDLYPDDAMLFEQNAENYKAELADLDEEIREMLALKTNRRIVTFHESFPYFAQDYDLEVVASIEPFPGQEPTAEYLIEVSNTVRELQVTAIFREPELSDAVVQSLAIDLGIEIRTLEPLGGTVENDSYIKTMQRNADAIANAL